MTDIRTTAAVKALQKLQSADEATPGTAVTTDKVWPGFGSLEELSLPVYPERGYGIGPLTSHNYTPAIGARITLAPTEETYEEGAYLFEMGAVKVGSGVADGGGTGKVYSYPFWYQTASKPSQSTLGVRTWQVGGEANVNKAEFVFAEAITLEGKGNEPWMMSGTLLGRQNTNGVRRTAATIAFVTSTKKITDSGNGLVNFTTGMTIKVFGSGSNDGIYTIATGGVAGEIVTTEALVDEGAGNTITIEQYFDGGPTGPTLTTAEEALFNKTTVYLDPVAGTLGATAVSNTVRSCKVDFKTGIKGMITADGNLYFSHLEFVPPEITGTITMLYNGSAETEREYAKAGTPRLLRIRTVGTALTSAGSYTYKTRDIEGAIVWTSFDPPGDEDGVETVTGNFKFVYDSTAAKFCTVRYVNQVASLG